MTFWLHVTAKARDDITRNAEWWARNYSVEEALRWYDQVYKQLDTVLQFPEGHSVAAEDAAFSYEIRGKLVGGRKRTYRAIFTVIGSEVRVLTVRRGTERALTSDEF